MAHRTGRRRVSETEQRDEEKLDYLYDPDPIVSDEPPVVFEEDDDEAMWWDAYLAIVDRAMEGAKGARISLDLCELEADDMLRALQHRRQASGG